MGMFRFICIITFLFLFLVCSIPLFFIEWVVGKFNRHAKDISSLRIVQWAFGVIIRMTGVELTVIGEENVPDEPVLFIGNHRSYFDIVITYARCKRLTGYVSKKEMESFPLLSIWMKYLYCLFLDRENARAGLKTILTAIEYVKNGVSICIFPEGTRNDGEELSVQDCHQDRLRDCPNFHQQHGGHVRGTFAARQKNARRHRVWPAHLSGQIRQGHEKAHW